MQYLARPTTSRRGDTIIEVTIAIIIFGMVAVLAIGLMNSSVNTAQANLEITAARNEINAQAEALRFIHNSFTLERNLVDEKQQYVPIWRNIASIAELNQPQPDMANPISNYPVSSCERIYDASFNEITSDGGERNIFLDSAFIINVRNIRAYSTAEVKEHPEMNDEINQSVVIFSGTRGIHTSSSDFNTSVRTDWFQPTPLYPRIIYSETDVSVPGALLNPNQIADTTVTGVQGIWIVPVASQSVSSQENPEYYDFHIRTCWYAPGRRAPSTIGTVIRLYNPEFFEEEQNV